MEQERIVLPGFAPSNLAEVNARLVTAGFSVHHLSHERASLEAHYLSMTEEEA